MVMIQAERVVRAFRYRLFPDGWGSVLRYMGMLLLLLLAFISLFPLYFCIITSLKPRHLQSTYPPSLVLTAPTLENYSRFLRGIGLSNAPVLRWFLNSTFVTVAVTVGQLVISALAGYAFARKSFWGRGVVFSVVIGSMLIPGWSTIIASYVLTYRMRLHDTYWVLILPGLASPFAVFLVRQFMLTLPTELFQAAVVDGATEIGIWWRIAVPLCKPALAALAMFNVVGTWNDFLWPLLVINKSKMYTVPVGVAQMMYQIQGAGENTGIAMSAAILMSIVPIVAFLLMQKQMVQGLTIGALKG
jgi:multiple sugar transport system permease protein